MGPDTKSFLTRGIKSLGVAYGLFATAFLGFAIQVTGISLTDQHLEPLLPPSRVLEYVEYLGIGLTFFAPFFSLGALSIIRSNNAQITSWSKKIFLWTLAVVAVLESFAACWWTCSGHPTWIQGYP